MQSMSRQPMKRLTLLTIGIVFCQIFCEIAKQVSNYSIKYYNEGIYPLPQTAIVVLVEVIKLLVTIIRAKGSIPSLSITSLKSSLRFLLPGMLYALNNNIYFFGLTMVPPPIWLILCSMRTAITASIYKFFLKRPLTSWQFIGALLIVMSIVIAKIPDILGKSLVVNSVPLLAIGLAMIASTNSVCAAVYTESLFKSGGGIKGESFLDQQFWLYSYGIIISIVVHIIPNPYYGISQYLRDVERMSGAVFSFFLVALLVSSIGGLVVASILKYLDNIVKEYSGSVANVLTAIVCAYLFPDKFEFNIFIVISLICLFVGIYLYENMKAEPSNNYH
ncbi:uncharacterized protein LOC131886999 isoform X2 [Tigriopus californicus]|nr:uncharacterized protein LOC131886999 isoform X2 [Tigriopus californicus]